MTKWARPSEDHHFGRASSCFGEVVSALRRIATDQRLAIVLYHYAGLSIEEIAQETGATASTVKTRLVRGRRALAPHLSEFAQSIEKPRVPCPSRSLEISGGEI